MIEYMHIQRFKALLDAEFKLSNLNIFSGLNGMGKSSVLQTLLLLRQSYKSNMLLQEGLLLNGDYVSLGNGQDILNENTKEETIEFLLKFKNNKSLLFNFKYESQRDVQPIQNNNLSEFNFKGFNLFNNNFQYLSAERINPQTSYKMSHYNINTLNSIGNNGEYTAHYIEANNFKDISLTEIKHTNAVSEKLNENLNCWMSEISPEIKINVFNPKNSDSVLLSYSFKQGKIYSAEYKPQNVGFGITFVLPVLTAILKAKKGDLLIIENPESHLHPAGQSLVGKMCAIAAQNGVQLFIETHSDHFLNGVRVAVKEKLIDCKNTALFFFERDEKNISSNVINPKIDENGRIDKWPKGFFDEFDNQLEKLL